MKLHPQLEYYKVKVSHTKHLVIGKKDDTYHFFVRKLSTCKKVSGWKLVYSRKRLHVIEREFYFSKETLLALNYFVNKF